MDADLVLEGGGVKGIGLVGAFSALSTRLHVPPDRGNVGRRDRRRVDRRRHAARGAPGRDAHGRLRAVRGRGVRRPPGLGGQGRLDPVREGDLRGPLPGRVAGRDPDGPRRAHVRRSAHRGPGLLAAARAGLQARRDGLRRHEGRAGAAALGLPEVRSGCRRPTGRRRRARVDVDPVLLRAAALLRARRARRTGPLVHGRRRDAVELPDRGVRPDGRQAAPVAHVRDQALGEAVEPQRSGSR